MSTATLEQVASKHDILDSGEFLGLTFSGLVEVRWSIRRDGSWLIVSSGVDATERTVGRGWHELSNALRWGIASLDGLSGPPEDLFERLLVRATTMREDGGTHG